MKEKQIILTWYDTLFYYDQPLLIATKDQFNDSYICVMITCDKDIDEFLCVPITKSRLHALNNEETDLRTIYLNTEINDVLIGTSVLGNLSNIKTEKIQTDYIPEDMLPGRERDSEG